MRDALTKEIVGNKFSITLRNYDVPLELVVLEGLNQVVARHAPVDQLHLRLVVVRFAVVRRWLKMALLSHVLYILRRRA